VTTIPTAQKPRGVVFAFHGCLQYVTEFGFKSASCPNCHGAQPAGVCRSAPYPCIVPGLVHAALVQRPRRRSPWPRASLTALILSQAPRAVRCWSMPRGRAAIARRPAAGTPEMMTLVCAPRPPRPPDSIEQGAPRVPQGGLALPAGPALPVNA